MRCFVERLQLKLLMLALEVFAFNCNLQPLPVRVRTAHKWRPANGIANGRQHACIHSFLLRLGTCLSEHGSFGVSRPS
jgi:hypothetical protein